MTRLAFEKMHGAGNDFIMLDARDVTSGELGRDRIAAWCARGRGIGADGLIVAEPEGTDRVRMHYFNADGGEASMCGNGARCTAAYAHARGLMGRTGILATRRGDLGATVHAPGDVEVELPPYRDAELDLALEGSPYQRHHHCDTGVPHLVIPVDDVEAVPVVEHGRPLRMHARFQPAGVNVDWVAADASTAEWRLRTYERGVEAETLACGTGASAAAVTLVLGGLATSPVAIRTRGADLLIVTVDLETGRLLLRGPAVVAYTGEVKSDGG
jgi:diaminopimelate epimerase